MSLVEKPYIGVTGITQPQEAETVAKAFALCLPQNQTHQGMAGYLVSFRSLFSEAEYNPKYPKLEQLPDLLEITDPSCLNSIHYHTPEPHTLYDQVRNLLYRLNTKQALVKALQLNLAWPPVNEVQHLKAELPSLKLIMQIGPNVINEDPTQIEHNLRRYSDVVDYVLLDPSGGRGREFQPEEMVRLHRLVRRSLPDVVLIYSGGLSADNVAEKISRVRQLTGEGIFGIDAENELRTKLRGKSKLDLTKARRYIAEAAGVLISST